MVIISGGRQLYHMIFLGSKSSSVAPYLNHAREVCDDWMKYKLMAKIHLYAITNWNGAHVKEPNISNSSPIVEYCATPRTFYDWEGSYKVTE